MEELLTLSDENIFFEFVFNNNKYAAISVQDELNEGDGILLVEEEKSGEQLILKDIESQEEYYKVYSKYLELVEKLGDDENA